MTGFLLRFIGMAGEVPPGYPVPQMDSYLMSWDHNVRDPRKRPAWDWGQETWTTDPVNAWVFPTKENAMAVWSAASTVQPVRPDGRPNRPLMAYSTVTEPLDEIISKRAKSFPFLTAEDGAASVDMNPDDPRGSQVRMPIMDAVKNVRVSRTDTPPEATYDVPVEGSIPTARSTLRGVAPGEYPGVPFQVRDVPVIRFTARDVPGLRERTRRMWNSPIGHAFAKIDLDRSYGDRTGPSTFPAGEGKSALTLAGTTDVTTRGPMEGWGAQNPEDYTRGQDTLLRNSELYWVSRDMSGLLRHSANNIPTGTLEVTSVPHEAGFVVLEEPIPGLDAANAENDHLRIAAFGWGLVTVQGVRALHMEFYDQTNRMFSPVERELRLQNGLHDLYFLGASAWVLGTETDDFSGFYASASNVAKASFLEDRKLIHAFFLLIQQKIAVVNVRSPDRAERRRSQRAGYAALPDVRIVILRERYAPSVAPPGTSQIAWSHRWITSGHWKQHWHPKERIHVPTYIQPYQKGPKDKPLVIRPTVNAWRR